MADRRAYSHLLKKTQEVKEKYWNPSYSVQIPRTTENVTAALEGFRIL